METLELLREKFDAIFKMQDQASSYHKKILEDEKRNKNTGLLRALNKEIQSEYDVLHEELKKNHKDLYSDDPSAFDENETDEKFIFDERRNTLKDNLKNRKIYKVAYQV